MKVDTGETQVNDQLKNKNKNFQDACRHLWVSGAVSLTTDISSLRINWKS